MIINRYLIREIAKPLTVILGVFSALFASYNTARFLSDAVNGLLPTDTIIQLIALKALIALEVLIPISLYLSVVLSFGRLYGDSEFTAMFALRVTPARIMGAVLTLSGGLALVVAGLSLALRPWAYRQMHEISKRAEALLNIDEMEAGTFYVGDDGNRVIFIAHRAGPKAPGQDVFVQFKLHNRIRVVYARVAEQLERTAQDNRSLVRLIDAHVYDIGHGKDQDDRVLNVKGILLNTARSVEPPGYSSVAAGSVQLAASGSAEDVAEFQWRLSTPLSTLLLGMLGVPLSRARPRQNKYAKLGTAVLIYSGYYLLCTSARTWVQNGMVAGFPGIWWAPALLALVLLVALSGPGLSFNFRRRRA